MSHDAPFAMATPPPGAAPDWTIAQNWGAFTPDDHGVWDRLFARQTALLPGAPPTPFCAASTCCGSTVAAFPTLRG